MVREDIGIWSYFIKSILFVAGLMIFEENITDNNPQAKKALSNTSNVWVLMFSFLIFGVISYILTTKIIFK